MKESSRRDWKKTMGDSAEIQKNAESVEAIQSVQAELAQLRAERKATPRRVTIESLPEAERPTQLLPLNKIRENDRLSC